MHAYMICVCGISIYPYVCGINGILGIAFCKCMYVVSYLYVSKHAFLGVILI